MTMTLAAFRRLVNLSKQEVARIIFYQHASRMRIDKEPLAARNLLKIIDAALILSNDKGFRAMSLRELSIRAELSMGGLYGYIRNKDDLAQLIQDFGYTLTARILLDSLKDIHAPLEQLRVAVHTQLMLSELLSDWFSFAYFEVKYLPAPAQRQAMQAETSTEELFANIIGAGQRQGLFRDADPRLSAALLQAMLQDWFLKRWKYQERQTDIETYAEGILGLLEGHLLTA